MFATSIRAIARVCYPPSTPAHDLMFHIQITQHLWGKAVTNNYRSEAETRQLHLAYLRREGTKKKLLQMFHNVSSILERCPSNSLDFLEKRLAQNGLPCHAVNFFKEGERVYVQRYLVGCAAGNRMRRNSQNVAAVVAREHNVAPRLTNFVVTTQPYILHVVRLK
jgi:hypothetical protein